MTTKESIKRGFIALYLKKDYSQIAIKSLCAEIPIARTTFYSYYNNLGEVKSEIEDETVSGIRAVCAEIYGSEVQIHFMQTLDYVQKNRAVFYAFLAVRPNADFISKFKSEIKKHFIDAHPQIKSETTNRELELEIFASAVIAFYTYYLEHPAEADLEKLSAEFAKFIKTVPQFL